MGDSGPVDDPHTPRINPATGLPMTGSLDTAGNPYGTDTSTGPEHGHTGLADDGTPSPFNDDIDHSRLSGGFSGLDDDWGVGGSSSPFDD